MLVIRVVFSESDEGMVVFTVAVCCGDLWGVFMVEASAAMKLVDCSTVVGAAPSRCTDM